MTSTPSAPSAPSTVTLRHRGIRVAYTLAGSTAAWMGHLIFASGFVRYTCNVAGTTFDPFTLTASQLDTLRAFARDYGSYYAGDTLFNSSNRIPSGRPIVFIDGNMTTSGNPYVGNAFNGWLIVVGTATLAGNGTINGMLYTTNDIQSSSGTNTINGVAISQNETNNTGIDTTTTGNMTINYNCSNARGNSNFARKWFPKPGGWREPAG